MSPSWIIARAHEIQGKWYPPFPKLPEVPSPFFRVGMTDEIYQYNFAK
jgi:hypothetical protein